MRRKAFDTILTAGGAMLAVVLLVAGGLLLWGANFANSSVHNQLADQKIFFPVKGSPALASPLIGPYLNQYAGQQLLTGPQAKAYADHFIAVHVAEAAGGKTYAEVSTLAQQQPTNTALAQQKQTLFQGETLRGLLLEGYAFSKIGQIAMIAAVSSFVLAAMMLVLTAFGIFHLRRVSVTEDILDPRPVTRPRPAIA